MLRKKYTICLPEKVYGILKKMAGQNGKSLSGMTMSLVVESLIRDYQYKYEELMTVDDLSPSGRKK